MTKYKLIRSNRKNIVLQIKGDGRMIVRAPLNTPQAEIQRFVDAKAAQLFRETGGELCLKHVSRMLTEERLHQKNHR